jgi:nitrogen fixation protein NifU and related proteins
VDVDELLDRYEQPAYRGTLPSPPARTASATNPRCGDVVTIFALVEEDRFTSVRFEGGGCTISQAAADVVAELAHGQPIASVRALTLSALLDRLGRESVGSRLDCAAVGLRALHDLDH